MSGDDILFLAHRTPFPPDRGDKIRSFNLLRFLAQRARVHLLSFADSADDMGHDAALGELCASHRILWRGKSRLRGLGEALVSGRPVSLTSFADPAMHRAAGEVIARERIGAIFVFSGQMAQYVPGDWRGRFVMDFCDLDSAKFAGYAARATPLLRVLLKREAHRLGLFERAVAARADASLFVSAAEAALFDGPRVQVIENGIDSARFDPAAAPPSERGAAAQIVFTGQMDYPPNVEAVRWFADEVLPRIDGAHFAIVGRAPVPEVRVLAGDRVTVTGAVPDTRGWIAGADVVVAPLRHARGIQNKVLEAMAMARPVVASAEAAEGIDHGGTIAVAYDAESFADRVATLIGDRAAADAMGKAARARVLARYGWDARLARLAPLLGLDDARAAA
ncbi:TIGR03087 family PEP-CTERM/XrtA system glycosyltransferase [Sphingomonas baiyangensis]|uniref:TIGR03087 family PEP-CTERM/XrtA system glycosyltransferase n=1 Tax=Sphingomonas baiyangensis TaxID=2572576 RepID=A0A4U1L378_9SPHN|nr:TIGR03087 family PEP-CTERM/XrtA system glycosyltransferase [Sphingomonas baiyangensis]TKD50924.1 TIGR03087 family PEP-CTERM/XrtA system glycosyltransferase [Sphingomonas baiyangensis]